MRNEGVGIWASPELFESCAGLPVTKAIRSITSTVIQNEIENHIRPTLLSIGIGPAIMYEVFKDKLQAGELRLFALDLLPEMINQAKSNLKTGEIIKSFGNFSPTETSVQFLVHDIRKGLKIPPKSVDIAEAGLVLHHVLLKNELLKILRNIKKSLKIGGKFVLGDIDVAIGEYVESKLLKLQSKFETVEIDEQAGEFICNSPETKARFKILDPKRKSDQKVIQNMDRITCSPLIEEMHQFNPSIEKPIMDNVTNAKKGLEWHRSLEGENGWLQIIREAFPNCDITTVRPEKIRSQFPSVLDNPFIIIVTNK